MNPGRICLGKHLALRTVYLVIACVLSVFDIGPILDEDGNPRMPKIKFDDAARSVFLKSSIHTAADVDRLATGIPIHSNVLSSLVLKAPRSWWRKQERAGKWRCKFVYEYLGIHSPATTFSATLCILIFALFCHPKSFVVHALNKMGSCRHDSPFGGLTPHH